MTNRCDQTSRGHRQTTSRRSFVQGSGAAVLGAVAARAGAKAGGRDGRARGDDTLRIALVGCGGRGTGAAAQALATDGPVELVAMADAFRDRLDACYDGLRERHGERVQVPEENKYVGFDAYRSAIDSGADVVVMAAPPGFRPEHFSYAVERGKHVFMEKPLAVDAPGVRQVLSAGEEARRRGLKVGVGLQRHHDPVPEQERSERREDEYRAAEQRPHERTRDGGRHPGHRDSRRPFARRAAPPSAHAEACR